MEPQAANLNLDLICLILDLVFHLQTSSVKRSLKKKDISFRMIIDYCLVYGSVHVYPTILQPHSGTGSGH
jgi:hypothetical protein